MLQVWNFLDPLVGKSTQQKYKYLIYQEGGWKIHPSRNGNLIYQGRLLFVELKQKSLICMV